MAGREGQPTEMVHGQAVRRPGATGEGLHRSEENLGAEVRACFYLLDGESVVAADSAGRLFLMSVPNFEVQAQAQTTFKVMCGDLAPSGLQLALGAEDG